MDHGIKLVMIFAISMDGVISTIPTWVQYSITLANPKSLEKVRDVYIVNLCRVLVPISDQSVLEDLPTPVEILQQRHQLIHLLQYQEVVQLRT